VQSSSSGFVQQNIPLTLSAVAVVAVLVASLFVIRKRRSAEN
jgi:hypothetical protein